MCLLGKWLMMSTVIMLLDLPVDSQGRAVNISNTWTLPQEGYSVFYRFFRDKISWYEADAVCQFHHATLVTVENGVQFDAARAFLKELDVTEFVWIGLMRQQDSPHFVWSSKPLDPSSGYWADPFPVMDSPLCAVIDPIRDYRWHALRCGGPETAAFLCEMEVPDWATECTVSAIPSLTVQYMSDSGTVEMSRDCGEEGTRHMPCRGQSGTERDTILNELRCIDESLDNNTTVTTPYTNTKATLTVTGTSTKSPSMAPLNLQQPTSTMTSDPANHIADVMTSVQTDNMEDNTIPNQTASTSLDDFMMADQPMKMPKPVAGRMKKVQPRDKLGKKDYSAKKAAKKLDASSEMMMGDQPFGEDYIPDLTVSQPHEKKSFNLKGEQLHTELLGINSVSSTEPLLVTSTTETSTIKIDEPTTIQSTTTESRQRRQTIGNEHQVDEWTTSSTGIFEQTPTTTVLPSSASGSTLFDIPLTTEHPHKVTVNESVDHFVPPLLLVRTKFTSSVMASTPHHDTVTVEPSTLAPTMKPERNVSTQSINIAQTDADPNTNIVEKHMLAIVESTITTTPKPTPTEHDLTILHDSSTTSPGTTSLPEQTSSSSTTSSPVQTTTAHQETSPTIGHPRFHHPHTPQRVPDGTPENRHIVTPSKDDPNHLASHLPHHSFQLPVAPSVDEPLMSSVYKTTKPPTTRPLDTDTTPTPGQSHEGSGADETTTSDLTNKPPGDSSSENTSSEQRTFDPAEATNAATSLTPSTTNHHYGDLTNKENYQAYRPNRNRMLYKVDKHTYLKKMFG